MPALVAGIHAFRLLLKQGVDGRDKPGHDNGRYSIAAPVSMRTG
jgi:hypothetical protein